MKNIVLITGATSGIGRAAAIKFAQNNYDLIITGRRNDRLIELKSIIETKYKNKVHTLAFDISQFQEVKTAVDSIPSEWKNISILVNNAGLALGLDPIQDGNISDWEQMIDTNIKGLLYITKLIAPIMIDNKKGHIINIGSIAGKQVYPNGNVYCATKFSVGALSQAMRIDLLKHKIKVTQVSPGATNTEFSTVRFKNDTSKVSNVYKGYTPLIAEDVADTIFFVSSLPPHVNIDELQITPLAQGNVYLYNKE